DVLRRVGEPGHRQPDAVAGEQLEAAQLVAAAGDRRALVRGERAHHLELAHHRAAVERVRRTDARDHGVEALELLALEDDLRPPRRDVHVAAEVVDDLDLVAARLPRLPEAVGGVQVRVAGQESDLHEGRENLSPPPTNERPASTTNRRRIADRPSNMRNPISSRLARLNSMSSG